MRKVILLTVILSFIPVIAFSQFKSSAELPKIGDALTKPSVSFLLGWFNPEKFEMNQTFSMNYMTVGGQSLVLNTYMNTIYYQISNPLTLRLNLGVAATPFNTFGNNPALNKTQFFGSAELRYKPTNNITFQIGINKGPAYFSPYPYRWNRNRWNEQDDF